MYKIEFIEKGMELYNEKMFHMLDGACDDYDNDCGLYCPAYYPYGQC